MGAEKVLSRLGRTDPSEVPAMLVEMKRFRVDVNNDDESRTGMYFE
jgi:hypothetical protein